MSKESISSLPTSKKMDLEKSFHFELVKPVGKLSTFVQGIWAVSFSQYESEAVVESKPIVKPLYPDAASGIIFNLGDAITIDDYVLPKGIIALPVGKTSRLISLPPASLLAGIRFHPAIAYGIFSKHYDEPTLISTEDISPWQLPQLFNALVMDALTFNRLGNTLDKTQKSTVFIQRIMAWAETHINYLDVLPKPLEKAFDAINHVEKIEQLQGTVHMSQRHIERLFSTWLDMTPKHFQRVLRTHHAITFLRDHPQADLAEVASSFGFSDQAHMTREFRNIASTTPRKISQSV